MKILLEGRELKAILEEIFPNLTRFRQNCLDFDFEKQTWKDTWVEFFCYESKVVLIIDENKETRIESPKDEFTKFLIKERIKEIMERKV